MEHSSRLFGSTNLSRASIDRCMRENRAVRFHRIRDFKQYYFNSIPPTPSVASCLRVMQANHSSNHNSTSNSSSSSNNSNTSNTSNHSTTITFTTIITITTFTTIITITIFTTIITIATIISSIISTVVPPTSEAVSCESDKTVYIYIYIYIYIPMCIYIYIQT